PRPSSPRPAASPAPRGAASARPSARGRAAAGVTSVRIGDMDRLERDHARAERTKRAAQASKRPLIIVGVIAAIVLALAVAWFALARTSAFAIENVEVTGADHLTTNEVSQLVSIPQGTTLLSVDVDAIKSSLERDSWVESVSVSREFPSTLKVAVTERQVAAVVEVPVGSTQTIQNWAIASDGMWLMAIPSQDSEVGRTLSPKIYEDAESVLRITGVPYGLAPEIGAYCTDDNVNNALSIVDGMTTELADQVKKVTATDPASTLLTLENGVEIAFGTADDIREKERVVLAIMEENPTVVYINVRVVDRPTWRAA
ncbi:cell division protein FtsQ/DivIB, partial [Adlercreutzia sp. ZJ305]